MYSKIVDITPALAEEWLARTKVKNRNLSQDSIKKFARLMSTGHFKLTHQGIAFDPDGNLIDGQTRLRAVIVSGKTVRMQVTYDVTPDAKIAMDCGRRRSLKDVGALIGLDDSRAVPVMNAALRGGSSQYRACAPYEMQPILEAKKDDIEFALSCIGHRSNQYNPTVLGGLLVRAVGSHPKDRLRRFAEVVRSGSSPDTTIPPPSHSTTGTRRFELSVRAGPRTPSFIQR